MILISWKALRDASLNDPEIKGIIDLIETNVENQDSWSRYTGYSRMKDKLLALDGVLLYGERVVIPEILRPKILKFLHSAHQGTSSMMARVQDTIWWPKISLDIANMKDSCVTCRVNAPSLPKLPPVPPRIADYPMQILSSDILDLEGHLYLIIVD